MIDAKAVLALAHGATFTPRTEHPSGGEVRSIASVLDFDEREADFNMLRHVTCRHTDCTGEYCQRTRTVNGVSEQICRFKEGLARMVDTSSDAAVPPSLPTHFYAVAAPLKGHCERHLVSVGSGGRARARVSVRVGARVRVRFRERWRSSATVSATSAAHSATTTACARRHASAPLLPPRTRPSGPVALGGEQRGVRSYHYGCWYCCWCCG